MSGKGWVIFSVVGISIVLAGVTCYRTGGLALLPHNGRMFFNSPDRPLIDAIDRNDPAAIRDQLAKGRSVNVQGFQDVTPLMLALEHENFEAFQALLDAGADPNLQDSIGRSVMSTAAKMEDSRWLRAALRDGGDPNLVDHKNKYNRGQTPIFYAIKAHNAHNVEILIQAGADVEILDARGDSPLNTASFFAAYGCAKALIVGGAEIVPTERYGSDIRERVKERLESPPDRREKYLGDKLEDFEALVQLLDELEDQSKVE